MNLRDSLRTRFYPAHALWMVAAVAALDLVSPATVQLGTLYVVPAGYAAWFGGRRWGIPVICLVTASRLAVIWLVPPPWSLTITAINALVRFGALLLIVYLVDRVASQRRHLRVLEGLLPICSHCKRIRTEGNEWQQLERYISAHSQAHFSHGLCPTCLNKHYGEYASAGLR